MIKTIGLLVGLTITSISFAANETKPDLFVTADTAELTLQIPDSGSNTLDVDFYVRNDTQHPIFGANIDVVNPNPLPRGVTLATQAEDPSVNGLLCKSSGFVLQPKQYCILRFAVDSDVRSPLTLKPKVCTNRIHRCGTTDQVVTVRTSANLDVIPQIPFSAALLKEGQVIFSVVNNSVADSYTFTLQVPEIYESLITVDDANCQIPVEPSQGCRIRVTGNEENKDVRLVATGVIKGTRAGEVQTYQKTADAPLSLWWDAVSILRGDEQHLQVQSVELSKKDYFNTLAGDFKRSLSTNLFESVGTCSTNDVACDAPFITSCGRPPFDLPCTAWFKALDPFLQDFGTLDGTMTISFVGSFSNGLANQYLNQFALRYELGLYAGVTPTAEDPNSVQVWNGKQWSPLISAPNGEVKTMTIALGDLMVGGDFHELNDAQPHQPAHNLATWTGKEWQPIINNGNNGTAGPVNSIIVGPGEPVNIFNRQFTYFIGGDFPTALGNSVNNVAACQFDSTSELFNCDPLPDTVIGTTGPVHALLWDENNTRLFAGGHFNQAGSVNPAYNIAYNNGTKWQHLYFFYPGTNGPVYSLAYDNRDDILFLGGEFNFAGDFNNVVEHVAGWTDVSSDTQPQFFPLDTQYHGASGPVYSLFWNNFFDIIEPDSPSTLFTGGLFSWAGTTTQVFNNVARWTINNTPTESDPDRRPTDPSFWHGLCKYRDYSDPANPKHCASEKGVTGAPNSLVKAFAEQVTLTHNNIFVGGDFIRAGGSPSTNVACWDNTNGTWCNGYNMSLKSPVSSLLVAPSICIAKNISDCE